MVVKACNPQLSFLICINLLMFSCTGNKATNSLARENLYGHVKTIKDTTYSVNDSLDILHDHVVQASYSVYNKAGNTTESFSYTIWSGVASQTTTHKYDNEGKVIKSVMISNDGSKQMTTYYTYDEAGRMSEANDSVFFMGITRKEKDYYDERGNAVTIEQYQGGGLSHKMTCRYDDKNRLIEYKILARDTPVYAETYPTIDKEGNWIKSISLTNGKPNSVTVREIEYY